MTSTGPVFAFTVHRSGSTLLGRLLNCHPDLVLWGEHGGIINKFAEIERIIQAHHGPMTESGKPWLADYIASPDYRSRNFGPWTNAYDFSGVRQHARKAILEMFASRLSPGQRWGFKDIRYNSPHTAAYLAGLFPAGRFVLLRRAIPDAAVSNILVDWSQNALQPPGGTISPEMAEDIVRDVVYALLAVEQNFQAIQAAFPRRCFSLDYAVLATKNLPAILLMFDFLGLSIPPDVTARLEAALQLRTFETRKTPKRPGALTADFITRRATALLPALKAEITADGIDYSRLQARRGVGQYSFLIGDHGFESESISCMF